jgi:PIN domain nuclease of toxin-antitoxin system
MNLLLDTHVLLWWLDDHLALSQGARKAIEDQENLVFVSAVTLWEIRIKEALGKLELPADFGDVLRAQPFLFLDIAVNHANAIAELPDHHRDPFDRMRIAQAGTENLVVVTHDKHFKGYDVPLIEM